jgi:hypothetical protein
MMHRNRRLTATCATTSAVSRWWKAELEYWQAKRPEH